MDKFFQDQLLYDFYGDLLTKHQRKVMSLYYEENLGLTEIAESLSTSRQAVFDTIKRSLKTLKNFEEKLELLKKEREQKEKLEEVLKTVETCLKGGELSQDSRQSLQHSQFLLKELLEQ